MSGHRRISGIHLLAVALIGCAGGPTDGDPPSNPPPPPPPPPTVSVPRQSGRIALSAEMGCILDSAGEVKCWGKRPTRRIPPAGNRGYVALNGGYDHICALMTDSTATCWGGNRYGQLGDGTIVNRADPVPVAVAWKVTAISAAVYSTCALDADGAASCWGRNDVGALGIGERGFLSARSMPTRVLTPLRFQVLDGGWANCGLGFDGRAHCWGGVPGSFDVDMYRPAGDCRTAYYPWYAGEYCLTPTPIETTARFAVLGHDRCAITALGAASCWGIGTDGTFGDGRSWAYSVPAVPVSGNIRFTTLVHDGSTVCGLDDGGRAWCWGNNFRGQLGIGEAETLGGIGHSAVPRAVHGNHRFVALASIDGIVCGLDGSDQVWCWGISTTGLLGLDVVTESVPFPWKVRME